jgi:uncharacterized protein YrrD
MHVRYLSCLGTPVLAEDTEEMVGIVGGILLHPDRGTVEGFFLRAPGLFSPSSLFLSSLDIARFGRRLTVRDSGRVAPAREFLRVQPLLEDPRAVLGQKIRTESGADLGRCRDVQFETSTMRLTWLFPKKAFRWRDPISVKQIVEVRPDAIIVRDPPAPAVEKVMEEAERRLMPLLPETPEVT